jgi:hypothetical protein
MSSTSSTVLVQYSTAQDINNCSSHVITTHDTFDYFDSEFRWVSVWLVKRRIMGDFAQNQPQTHLILHVADLTPLETLHWRLLISTVTVPSAIKMALGGVKELHFAVWSKSSLINSSGTGL